MMLNRPLLEDILDATDEVTDTTSPTRELFDANKLVRFHLIRNIQIIGAATPEAMATEPPTASGGISVKIANEQMNGLIKESLRREMDAGWKDNRQGLLFPEEEAAQ